jgi:SAM-dependent methyltransferase
MSAGALDRFRELTAELRRATHESGDPELEAELGCFLQRYDGAEQDLPRASLELLNAQQLLRRLLLQTRRYGLVYQWYFRFKNPFEDEIEGPTDSDLSYIQSSAREYRWLSGYDTVLECGCGLAALGLVLAKHNQRWIASDVVRPSGLDTAITALSPGDRFEFAIIDAVSLEGVADDSVGAVVSRSFFEHLLLDDAAAHVASAFRVLEPGGDLIISCPAGVGPPSDITKRFPEYDTPQGLHIKEYRLHEIGKLLTDAGFGRVRSRFLQGRWTALLPLSVQRANALPLRQGMLVEAMAARTWPLLRRTAMGRKLWFQVWNHLGASAISVIATKTTGASA